LAPRRPRKRAALWRPRLDLLLCDLSLEEKASGFGVIEYALRLHPGLPSLLLTGYASKEVNDRAQRLGTSVLLKPFDIQEFLGVIRAHLRDAHEQKASGQ